MTQMSWDEMYELVRACMGRYVRVTVMTGAGRPARHPAGIVGSWSDYLTIGGMLVGGEYARAVLVEVRGDNGRYAPVTA